MVRAKFNTFRVDRHGNGTFDLVMRWCAGGTSFASTGSSSTSCVRSTPRTSTTAASIYRFFRDELGAKWVQFIPIIERATEQTIHLANRGWSEAAGPSTCCTRRYRQSRHRAFGGRAAVDLFLMDVFEEWVRHDCMPSSSCNCST